LRCHDGWTPLAHSQRFAVMNLLGMSPRRVLGLAKHIAGSSWFGHGPFKAVVCATYRCDCRCAFCGLWQRQCKELPASVLVEALAQIPTLCWIDLTGGEIFLRPDYLELCHGLATRLPNLALFHFPTAGQHGDASVNLVRTMAHRGIRTVVTVSLDGGATLHDRLRGLPGAWAKAVDTFRRLRLEPRVDVFIGTTLVPDNVERYPQDLIEAVRTEIPDLSPTELHVNVMQRSDHYFNNQQQPLPDPTEVAGALARVKDLRGSPQSPFALLEWAYQKVALRAAEGGHTPLCQALNASFYLAPDGVVQPCHIWDHPVGQVTSTTSNLAPFLKSAAAMEARAKIDGRRCLVCWTPCEAYPTLLSAAVNPRQLLTGKPF
jgi:Fe-coproporphyrin III synthase